MPKAPEGIEYRNPGIMESQIFTVLKVRLGSGRKSFCKPGASYLAKVCALKVEEKNQITLEKIEEPIKIDNSVEEWINAIEENIKIINNIGLIERNQKKILVLLKMY